MLALLSNFLNGIGEFADAFALGGGRADHRRLPAASTILRDGCQLQHGVKLLLEAFGAFAFGFVQHENICDLHQSCLHILHVVAQAGHDEHKRTFGQAHDVDFVLADADGFDQHDLLARRIQNQGRVGGGARKSA